MRSGSTLLKALLGEAEDVSHLAEVNFQRFARVPSEEAARRIAELSPGKIVVLKRPAWHHEVATYPKLPSLASLRCVSLVRDAYPTVRSLRRMSLGRWLGDRSGPLWNSWLVNRYWAPVTQRLIDVATELGPRGRIVRYEDVVGDPKGVTADLFRWMGSQRSEGVDSYSAPETSGGWRWGRDDGSERIRSRRVQPPREHPQEELGLSRVIENSPAANRIRRQLGYLPADS